MQTVTHRKIYPVGVPCWVELLAPDARAAAAFYSGLFAWERSGPGPMPDGGEYFVARVGGEDVAGIATLPATDTAASQWVTYVRVADVAKVASLAHVSGGSVIVPPLDTPPAGRLAIVADPSGATIGLWEPGEREGAQRVNEPRAWAMSALRTPDVKAAGSFYAALFGWTSQAFQAGAATGELYRLPGYVGGKPQQPVPRDVVAAGFEDASVATAQWGVDFWIDDLDAAIDRVSQFGGAVQVAPFDEAVFRRAVVSDPAGALFTLSQLVPERLS